MNRETTQYLCVLPSFCSYSGPQNFMYTFSLGPGQTVPAKKFVLFLNVVAFPEELDRKIDPSDQESRTIKPVLPRGGLVPCCAWKPPTPVRVEGEGVVLIGQNAFSKPVTNTFLKPNPPNSTGTRSLTGCECRSFSLPRHSNSGWTVKNSSRLF